MSDKSKPDDLLFAEVQDALKQSVTADAAISRTAPPSIDNFEIVRELHRGGQGIVFEALQQNPRRRVAIKVLLHGNFSSERQRYRFEREIQLIGTLNHPNIVTIFDSGFVEGQPYYAMEFIQGAPLNKSVRFKRPVNGTTAQSGQHIRDSLALMERICRAVAAFQQRGLIHRDLKPGNILVDADGRPHIVDFGLARPTDNVDANALQTRTGEFLGTLAYASPEQVSAQPDSVDTRSDIYALGVIMYELLVSALPHRCDDSIASVVQRITNEAPTLPSRLNKGIDRDVETIVMKALAREPDRRYQSAEQLALDLQLYLAGRPIDARRDSAIYVLRKNIRRHWAAFAAVTAFVVLLVASSLISLNLWKSAETRLARAVAAEAAALESQKDEAHQRIEAEFRGYVASLGAASGALNSHQIQDAYDHLHRVPRRLRDFEWWYILSRIDHSIATWNCDEGLQVLALSSDRKRVGVAGLSGVIRVTETDTGRHLLTRRDADPATALAFHPTNHTLLAGFDDGRLRELDLTDNTWIRELKPLNGAINAIALTPDATRLFASAGRDPYVPAELTIRDFSSDDVLVAEPTWVRAIDFSPDGKRGVTGGDVLTIRDTTSGDVLSYTSLQSERCNQVKFSVDGTQIVAGMTDQTIRIFNSESLDEEFRFSCQAAETRDIAVHPQKKAIATAATDGTVRLWNAETGEAQQIFQGHLSWVNGLAFVQDGRRLISLEQKGAVKSWNTNADVGDFKTKAHDSSAFGLRYSSTGDMIATCSYSARIKLWDVASGTRLKTLEGHTASVNGIDISPDDQLLASASTDNTVRLWDLESGQCRLLKGHTDEVLATAFSPDGKLLASGGTDRTIRLWNVASGSEANVLRSEGDQAVRWIRFVPDGKRLLVEKRESFEVWNVAERRLERHWFPPRNMWFATAAMHPNGKKVAIGDDAGRIQLWDIDSGQAVARLEWHSMSITALRFNPSGTRLAAASTDGAVKIWHVDRQEEVLSLPASANIVQCLDFSPDGRRLAAGQRDGTMVWREAIPPAERLGARF